MPRSNTKPLQKKSVVVHTPAPAPAPAHAAVAVQPRPSFVQTIKEGFAFGAGSAVAHNAVNSIFRSFGSESKPEAKPIHDPCSKLRMEYEVCMKTDPIDVNCVSTYYPYTQCLQENKSMS